MPKRTRTPRDLRQMTKEEQEIELTARWLDECRCINDEIDIERGIVLNSLERVKVLQNVLKRAEEMEKGKKHNGEKYKKHG